MPKWVSLCAPLCRCPFVPLCAGVPLCPFVPVSLCAFCAQKVGVLLCTFVHTKNLRAVQLLPDHTKMESTVRYLGIEVEDALEMAEQTEI